MCLPGSGLRNQRAAHGVNWAVAQSQPWLPYCNGKKSRAVLWCWVSEVLNKEGLNDSPRAALAQLLLAS